MNLFTYLLHRATWQKLPMMPRSYSVDFDRKDVNDVTVQIMQLSHVRSPQNVKALMKKHNASTPEELLDILTYRKRPRYLRNRILGLLRRAAGVLPYDPMKEISRQHMKRGRR